MTGFTAMLFFVAPLVGMCGAFLLRTQGRLTVPKWHFPVGVILALAGFGLGLYYAFATEWSSAGIVVFGASFLPSVFALIFGRK